MITVCATNPRQIVAIYKKLRSINDLKNKVINALQTNNIISTDGSLSLLLSNTAINEGIVERCKRIILIQPNVWALTLPKCVVIKYQTKLGARLAELITESNMVNPYR